MMIIIITKATVKNIIIMTTMIINIIMMIITTIMTITTITMIIKEVRIPDMVKEAQEERKKTQSLELE